MFLFDLIVTFIKSFSKRVPPQAPIPIPMPLPDVPLPVPMPAPILPRQKLYLVAVSCLGTDASPSDIAPDEDGCMETVDDIYFKTFGEYINGTKNKVTISTFDGYNLLKKNPKLKQTLDFKPGNIIISPTTMGYDPTESGHVGICMDNNTIASNNSFGILKGKFTKNYTFDGWVRAFRVKYGFPIFIFERIT